jgi:SAM-dependent MidA family methyltransferase
MSRNTKAQRTPQPVPSWNSGPARTSCWPRSPPAPLHSPPCSCGHAYADPLANPGAADLTAHVQFATLARKARACGLAADGPLAQAEFLGRLGIVERTARLMAANPARAGAIEAATQRLISPGGMGGHFKAMVVRCPSLPPPPPFG